MKRVLTLVLCLPFFSLLYAQQPLTWPEITREAKPWTRWWWMGSAVEKQELTRLMGTYREAGLGGMEVTTIYGVRGEEARFRPYLSPEWMDAFTHVLGEADRLDLGIDLANASGWPFGGPWVEKGHSPKYMELRSWSLGSGQSLGEAVSLMQEPVLRTAGPYRPEWAELIQPISRTPNLQEKALDQVRFAESMQLVSLMAYGPRDQTLDLTRRVDRDGQLRWVAPEGSWTLYALFQGWHGKMVERAGPGGEGHVIDHFSEEATRDFLQHFDTAFAGYDLSTLRGFFNDSYEVDDARGEADWTDDFLQAFRRRRGYDLRDYLPALDGAMGPDTSSRVICDYRETLSDLLLDNFTRTWDAWADRYGKITRNQAHGSPANILDLYAAVDIPEAEGTDILRAKFASSAAHVTGKRLASAEAATWLDQHFRSGLGDVKLALDRFMIAGINHLFYHGTAYSPADADWPGWLFYAAVHFNPANSWWPHFSALNAYVARCQAFLQQGTPQNDVLVYFPIHDRWSEPGEYRLQHYDGFDDIPEDWPARQLSEALIEQGYSFDFISDRQLDGLTVESEGLLTGGASYVAIVVPKTRSMPLPTFRRLLALAEEGATVLFQEGLPSATAGWGDFSRKEEAFKALQAGLSFGDMPASRALRAGIGEGQFVTGELVEDLMNAVDISREIMADLGLQYIRRAVDGEVIYFIHNPDPERVVGNITLTRALPNVAAFDPMSGQVGVLPVETSDAGVQVPLDLGGGSSLILRTSEAAFRGEAWPVLAMGERSIQLDGPVELRFLEGGPELPPVRQLEEPVLWTTLDDPALDRFSGIAAYEFSFSDPGLDTEWLALELGEVRGSARVLMNGEELGFVLGPDNRLRVPAEALRAQNLLEIQVANTMANRIAWMDKQGIGWKKFYNINFSSRTREDVGANGVFTAERWLPMPSGLAGPVLLRELEAGPAR